VELHGIDSLEKLMLVDEREMFKMHCVGRSALTKLGVLLEEKNLSFGGNYDATNVHHEADLLL
jgi:hypothetical protein